MTSVDIANLALSYLGDTATVTSLDPPDGSAQAQHCARFYPIALKLMLETHQWSFITKRAYLAVSQAEYFGEWAFAYAMPSDASGIISVLPQDAYLASALGYPAFWFNQPTPTPFEVNACGDFQVEVIKTQQVILSNAENAVARYTATAVQPGMFPAQFTDGLAWKLASMLAGPLLKGDVGAAESKRCLQMHAAMASQAKMQDANQRQESSQPVPSAIAARY